MAKVILQAIKMAPRLLWLIYAQPSKMYDFVMGDGDNKENIFISTFSFFFSGLVVGIILAIPHYFFHHDLWRSLVWALGFGVTFSIAFAFAVTFTFAGSFAIAMAFVLAYLFTDVSTFAFAGAVLFTFAFQRESTFTRAVAFLFAFGLALAAALKSGKTDFGITLQPFIAQPSGKLTFLLLCILFLILVYLAFKVKLKIKSGHILVPILFAVSAAFLFLAGEGGRGMMNSFEALQYPFSFWWTYIICMSFVFSAEIGTKALSFSGKEYASFQKSAIFWGPILALFIYLESQSEKVAMKDPLVIIALGFLVIPLFIAHRAKAWKKEVSFLPPAEIYWYLSRGEWHLSVAIRELEKKKGYRFNEEMIKTLQAALGFQRCKTLKDIETACMVLEEIKEFPAEIDYFVFFEKRIPQLSNVKDALLSIDSIDGIEGRRDLLSHQKRNLEVLLQNVQEELFEPFKDIWERGLKKSIGIIEAEIKRLQNFPALSIDLKNKDSSVSAEAQNLYFEVHNKANKLALDASINSLEVVEGPIYLADTPRKKIAVIESDAVKEISWPMRAKANGKAIVRGSFTFSDRAGENYLMDFSFPVTVKKRSTQFKEIKNPYTVGQPLKGDDPHYFGREDAYDFIDKNITAPGNGHIIVYGLRRTGKTSILHRIESKGFTDQRLVPVTLGIQGIADEKDFFYSLSTGIKEKLSLSSGAAVENFGSFRQFIKEIKPELGERTIVLMIDELEVLQTKVKDDRISRTFFSNLRHLMQHETKLVFLFCSIHKPEEMSVDDWSIFSNTVTNLKISRLKRNEALRLIEEPVKGQLNYDDLAVEHILKMTAGQPYLVQLICRTLVNNLNENKKRNAVLIDDVDEAVGNIIANDQDCFSRGIWQEATLLERLVLSSIAEELRLKQLERAGPGAVYERIQTVTPKFAGRHVLGALEKLADREILAEKDEHYSFPVSLLHKWISTRCPLRKVREKIQLKVKMS